MSVAMHIEIASMDSYRKVGKGMTNMLPSHWAIENVNKWRQIGLSMDFRMMKLYAVKYF